MKNWFERDVRQSVEDKFSSLPVYRAVRSIALRLMNEANDFALHPADVFYHAFVTIDMLRGMNAKSRQQYCACEMWEELLNEFLDVEPNKEEVKTATALVMYYCGYLLIASGNTRYSSASGPLICQVGVHAGEFATLMEPAFETNFNRFDEEVRTFMQEYLPSGRMISEEVEQIIDEVKASAASGEVKTIVEDSGIRFKGNQTALMYVLEAMHKADWFTDAEGKPIRSKDKAIKAILKHAFCIENPNLSQLRNAAKNRNLKTPSDYFDELKSYLEEE